MRAADAFGHVLSRHLHMDAARPGAFRGMRLEEAAHLAENGVEPAGLAAMGGRDGVAMHRVGQPDDRCARLPHGAQQARQLALELVHAHPADEREPPRLVLGVQPVDEAQQVLGLGRRADLQPDRVADAAHELDMRAVQLAGAVADPEEMRRTGIGVAGRGIDARQRLLIGQQQRLVAGVEIRLADLRRGFGGHAAGAHEVQRLVDPRRQILVAGGQRAALDEAEVPAMDAVQIGIAAGREGAQQVERARRLEIAGLHPRGVRHPGFGREGRAVDDVAAIARERVLADGLGLGAARLGELARHAAHLHHRHAAAVGQHHRHLQQHAEGVADDVGGKIVEALGAVAALQHEGAALGDAGEGGLQPPRLAGKNQRRVAAQPALDRGELRGVRIGGHLPHRPGAPAIGAP